MCRIAAYFGPPLRLSTVLRDAPHSLTHQSQAAREMGHSVAGDGWGVGWFSEPGDGPPGLLKSILPLWSDLNAKTATHAIASGTIVGHIRWASPGSEVCFTNTPLFVFGDHLFTINGELKPWPGPLARALRSRLDDEAEAAIQGSTDAEMLGALWQTWFRRTEEKDAGLALREALLEARQVARAEGGALRAGVIVAGREGLAAARFSDPESPPSLHYLLGEGRWRGGVLVVSEPLDDGPGWKDVEPSALLRVDKRGLRWESL